ncbi:DUF697 domain-containing protein [Spirulina sp. CS-785/01]|uniref:slr1306 family protein n=1 Tax=Spirulina sp. CS-785/01 TaxID=3021716 RepID=UPI00232E4F52|nr:DUF697 domain-containing protein [Spirulina sp. CS-785/01]MDB9314375.1 DUF697 domain-containing protein [Spirulina sp. CS-785/01]
MAIKFRKPVLIGGVGLSFGLSLWWLLQPSLGEVKELGLMGVMLLGGGLWWWKQGRSPSVTLPPSPAKITQKEVEGAIQQGYTLLETLTQEAPDADITDLKAALGEIRPKLDREGLKLAIAGSPLTGKTALHQALTQVSLPDPLTWREGPVEGEFTDEDLMIFLTSGDLTESDLQRLKHLKHQHQRVILAFNKQDRYPPEEKALILQQLRWRTQTILSPQDIIPLAAAPAPVKVRQHQANGEIREYWEDQKPEIEELRDRVTTILSQEKTALITATTWREALQLQTQIQTRLNQVRRDRAMPIIEKYQWIAATAAFANPVPTLDLLATAAINAQLVIDLGKLYQQKITLAQAQTATGTIGQLMVKLGLVELSYKAISPLLKSNTVTYIAGGVLEGVSAAYFTRLAALSIIEYLQEQTINPNSETGFNLDQLSEKLQQVFHHNQRNQFFRQFVPQTMKRLAVDS